MAGFDRRRSGGGSPRNAVLEARAPYNFVSFDYMPLRRYQTAEELPRHDVMDAALLSGEIHLTLTAKTPLCVRNGEQEEGSGKPDFVRGADGVYTIPGSTLRGLLRQTMQILGQGLIRPDEDFADKKLFYRSLADSAASLAKPRKDYYTATLGVKAVPAVDANGAAIRGPRTGRQKNYSVAQNVHGGYLHKDGDGYYITPTAGKYVSISRKSPLAGKWSQICAKYVPVWYRMSGGNVTDIQTVELEGYDRGMLVSPGYMQNQNRLYLFPKEDTGKRIDLKSEEWLDYAEDFKDRENGLSGTKKNMAPAYWKLPGSGECKPVFYCFDQGRTLFGMSQFIRIPYLHRFSEGLPEQHRLEDDLFLDYPYAVMGFAGKEQSYRSRVSVGNLRAQNANCRAQKVDVVLAEPKTSFFPNYVRGGRDYNQDDFRLNGYKQYWQKEASAQSTDKVNVRSAMYVLPVGTTFSGTIRYRNLHPDELGLLLWCIQLNNGLSKGEFHHTLGMGKPYGYGRVKAEITSLKELDFARLYADLAAGIEESGDLSGRIEQLVRLYQQKADQLLGYTDGKTSLRNHSHIREFFTMKKQICTNTADVSYMSLNDKEFRNTTVPLKTVEELRKKWNDEKQRNSAQPKNAAAKQSSQTNLSGFAKLAQWGNKN